MTDVIIIAVVALIVFAAGYYVYRAKKSGKKCIGCPDSASCGANRCSSGSTCQGSCSCCGHHSEK